MHKHILFLHMKFFSMYILFFTVCRLYAVLVAIMGEEGSYRYECATENKMDQKGFCSFAFFIN
jgi:hypothetical protein